MPEQKKLGLHLSLVDGTPAERLAFAREAEGLGYTSIWTTEVAGPDALVSLGPLALNTSKVQLATGVVPIQIRTPGVMGIAFLTIHELSAGRAIAGLGVSSPVLVERWHGAVYRKPVTAMRECVAIMRQLFTHGRAKLEGEVYRCDFRLGFRPAAKHPPKIYLAALNAPMLRLAGEVADGVLMNYSPPEAVGAMVKEIHEGARKAGRNLAEVDLAIYARICITDEQDKALDAFRRELATYAFVDSYNRMFARYGLGDELAQVRRLWKRGKRNDAPKAISEASARKIAAFGPAWDGRDFIARFRAAGITHPVVFPVGPAATFVRDAANTMRAMAGS
jgi:probable F420-dependent oxidoreductase